MNKTALPTYTASEIEKTIKCCKPMQPLKLELLLLRLAKEMDLFKALDLIRAYFKSELGVISTNAIANAVSGDKYPKTMFVNTNNPKELYPQLKMACFNKANELNLSPMQRANIEHYLNEFIQQWQRGNDTKQPQQAEQPQKQPQTACTVNTSRGKSKRGRQSAKPLANYILSDDKDKIITTLHGLIDGEKGQKVVYILQAFVEENILSEIPPFKAVTDEFGNIGANSGYYGQIKKLKDDLQSPNKENKNAAKARIKAIKVLIK